MKRLLFCLWIVAMFCCCGHPKSTQKSYGEVYDFVDARQYQLSLSKNAIPKLVIDSLSKIDDEKFEIADTKDSAKVNFGCVRMPGDYNRSLHFALLGNGVCLISYAEGGIGKHDVIDYFNYRRGFKHIRYTDSPKLNTIVALKVFLKKQALTVRNGDAYLH